MCSKLAQKRDDAEYGACLAGPHSDRVKEDLTEAPRLEATRSLSCLQGCLARKKRPPPWDYHRSIGIGLL